MSLLPERFEQWPAEAKQAHWAAYIAQDGSGTPYAERLRLATEAVRDRYAERAAAGDKSIVIFNAERGEQ